MTHDVFISHSAKDAAVAEAVCAHLERDGIPCWIAPRDAAAGRPWAGSLVDAIQASRVLLLVLTPHSNQSEHVVREVAAAARAKIPILTLRIGGERPSKELGYYILRDQWIDALPPPLESRLAALGGAVRALLAPQDAVEGARHAGSTIRRADQVALRASGWGSKRTRGIVVVALLVAVVGGAWTWLHRSATLAMESEPPGAVALLDGTAAGSTPLALTLEGGTHTVLVRHPGFKDWSKVVDLSAGERTSISLQLAVADARDAVAINLLGKPLGIALQRYTLPEAQRESPEGEPLELVVPRGSVRPSDLTALVMDVDLERAAPTGVVALRQGAQTLWETPFLPTTDVYEVSVPPEVREQVRPGASITWGWWPKDGPPVTLTFQVTDKASAVLSDIERLLGTQADTVRGQLRAQALLDLDLLTGAFLEARSLAQAQPADLRAQAVMEQVLSRSGAGESRLAAHLRAALRNAPPAERAWVFDTPAALPNR